jgi:hypothetical protein
LNVVLSYGIDFVMKKEILNHFTSVYGPKFKPIVIYVVGINPIIELN